MEKGWGGGGERISKEGAGVGLGEMGEGGKSKWGIRIDGWLKIP